MFVRGQFRHHCKLRDLRCCVSKLKHHSQYGIIQSGVLGSPVQAASKAVVPYEEKRTDECNHSEQVEDLPSSVNGSATLTHVRQHSNQRREDTSSNLRNEHDGSGLGVRNQQDFGEEAERVWEPHPHHPKYVEHVPHAEGDAQYD